MNGQDAILAPLSLRLGLSTEVLQTEMDSVRSTLLEARAVYACMKFCQHGYVFSARNQQ